MPSQNFTMEYESKYELKLQIAKLKEENVKLRVILNHLYEACMRADIEGDLSELISGEILDAAQQALNEVTPFQSDYMDHVRNMPESEYRRLHKNNWVDEENEAK